MKERLPNGRTDFMAPIAKQTIRSFNTMNKPVKVNTQGRIESVNIDRQIVSKLFCSWN